MTIFGIFSIFFQVFRCFHARRSAEKLFLVKNASVLTPWWPIFRNPVGVPGCLFLLHRFYTGNFAFLSEKNFFWYPEKNFFTRNIGHAPSYRLVSWSTDFSTLGVFKIAKWWKSTFCQFFFFRSIYQCDFRNIGTCFQKSFFTKMFLVLCRWKIYGFEIFLKPQRVLEIEKIAKNGDFWHIFNFFSSFSGFSRQTVKRKVVPHEKCQRFDTMMTYFPEPRRGSGMFVFTSSFLHGKFCIFKWKIF